MFRNVLVPVDLTDRHRRALEIAAHLVASGGGTVTLIHVIELLHGILREEDPAFYQRLETKVRTHLGRLLSDFPDPRPNARSLIRYGDRVGEVLGYARRESVDLIVLASHPVGFDIPGAEWPTLSYLIGIAARCPVMLVKE